MTQRKEMLHKASTGGKAGDNGENAPPGSRGRPVPLSHGLPHPCLGSCLAAPAPQFSPSFVSAFWSLSTQTFPTSFCPSQRRPSSPPARPPFQLLLSEYFATSSPLGVLACLLGTNKQINRKHNTTRRKANTKAWLATL